MVPSLNADTPDFFRPKGQPADSEIYVESPQQTVGPRSSAALAAGRFSINANPQEGAERVG